MKIIVVDMFSNKFKVLEDDDSNNYEDFEEISPYNKIIDGNWIALCLNSHPVAKLIRERISWLYDGKLLWREINKMKERIDKLKNALREYEDEVSPRMAKLNNLIREQKNLCKSDSLCAEELQKHLDICQSTYKCYDNYVAYECRFVDNGRCKHYYEIEYFQEELERYEYYIFEDKDKIMEIEVEYERALAVKEDRLKEYLDDLDDW